jgi:hypothetical protein
VLQLLEHHDARALAHDEAVAVAVVGAGGLLGLVRRLVERALQALKPAMPISQIAASAPPATMTSALPYLMRRAASPSAWRRWSRR